jgi:hypothetical protein
MTDGIKVSPASSRYRGSAPRRRHSSFSSAHVTMGAIHMAGMIAGILAADRMKSPGARWSAIAGFGVATGIGEAMWRERIERERDGQERGERE